MSEPDELLGQLLETRTMGTSAAIPEMLHDDFRLAAAAQSALRALLEDTVTEDTLRLPGREPPAVGDEYEILNELGQGGMGVVYLARQRSLNRMVALKVLRPGELTFGPLVQRFMDEARHLAQLRHPNIVSIHDVGDANGEPYFTMDFIPGESLAQTLSRGPLIPSRAVDILRQVALALQHAHRQGIIHRDLKPGNVLLDQAGQVFVTDFGLARNLSQDSSLTQSGELLGTPQYMAPEQARGQSALVGEATDIHALGLLLFEMLTGRPAFGAASPADVLVRLLNEDPPPLRRSDRRIPRDLETICLKCLQKAPAARYANVSALLEDLRRFETGEPLAARRPGLTTRCLKWLRRHWKIGATAALTAVLASCAAPWLFDQSFDELVVWGDEELAAGHPELAAQVYARALRKGTAEQQRLMAERLVNTCRLLPEPATAVELALQVLEHLPDADFGPHNYLVAQALVARERARSPGGTLNIWIGQPRPALELIKTRLELALAHNHSPQLSDAQRLDAEGTLTNVMLALSTDQPHVRYAPDYLHTLPTGTESALLTQLNDAGQHAWNRARAGIALGRQYADQGDSAQALQVWTQALQLARSVYPMYGGVRASGGSTTSRLQAPDAEECQLVAELVADIRRLDPATLPVPTGQLEFRVTGLQLPPSISVEFKLELCDPQVEYPDHGLPHDLPRLVPLRQDAPVSVGVLDGRYRLRYRGHHARWDVSVDRMARLLQVDVTDWPNEVEVHGNTVRLPPLHLRLAEDIQLLTLRDGTPADLSQAELRWQPVSGAARYQVQLLSVSDAPSPVTTYFLTLTTTDTTLRLDSLNAVERLQVTTNLVPGRTGGWHVDAYDAQGRRMGTSLSDGLFLVAAPLAPPTAAAQAEASGNQISTTPVPDSASNAAP